MARCVCFTPIAEVGCIETVSTMPFESILRLVSRFASPRQVADNLCESYMSFAFDASVLVVEAVIWS
jgi:hypothetical protein